MAARLAGRSNASFCKRALDRTRLVCDSNGIQAELWGLDNFRRELGEDNALAGSVGTSVPSTKDQRRLEAQDVSSSSSSDSRHCHQFTRTVSWARATGFLHTRSIAVQFLDDLQDVSARRLRGFSTFEEVDTVSKVAESITSPTPGDLHLPKLVNLTTELVKSVCGILEKQEWGPDTVKELEEANLVISPYLVKLIVERISRDEHLAWNFFMWAREKASMRLSLRAYMALVDSLGRAKNLELTKQAMKLIVEDGHRNKAWPYNDALKWFADDVDTALYFWTLMKENQCRPTVITYTRLIDVLAKHGRIEAASETFREMLQAGCPPNITTYNVLIHAFGAAGQVTAASDLFDKLSELGCKPNYGTYNALIIMHAEAGNTETALRYFNMLKATGADVGENVYKALQIPVPDGNSPEEPLGGKVGDATAGIGAPRVPEFVYSCDDVTPGRLMNPSILVRMIRREDEQSVVEKLDKVRPMIYPRFVVQVMQRLKNPDTALVFFDWAKRQPGFEHNAYSYSMMISILGRSKNSDVIERVLKEMYEQGIQINTQIFTALITCYGRAKSIDGALQLFQLMKDWGCQPDTIAYTSLIHLLAKHGNHDQAKEMFKEMQQARCAANSHTYTVMIYSLLKAGKVTEGFELLKQMPELGCKPTPVTYATLIHHYAKDGHLDLAKEILTMMENDGVKPLKTSLVALNVALRKAGRLQEADALVKKLRRQRIWDETFKVPTEAVARELVFKNFLPGQASTDQHAPVQS